MKQYCEKFVDLSIVIPVYNEIEAIKVSFERILSAITNSDLNQQRVEIIFINDGSTDGTHSVLSSFLEYNSSNLLIKVINFSRNFGHSSAVLAGLETSSGDLVAIIDADMQDPPELLPEMIKQISSGYDVVYGKRLSREGETFFKRISAWLFYRTVNVLSSIDIPNDAGDFRVMTREVVNAVLSCEDHAPFMRGLVAWVGFRQYPFPYHREERKLGITKYPLKKMIKFAWQAISSFSNTPLLLITYIGLFMTGVSLVIGIWAIYQYMNDNVIPGWTSLVLGFVGGNAMTLLMLGIMGLYLGKIIDQVRGRPRYIVKGISSEQTKTPDGPNRFPDNFPAHLGLPLTSLGESDRHLH